MEQIRIQQIKGLKDHENFEEFLTGLLKRIDELELKVKELEEEKNSN